MVFFVGLHVAIIFLIFLMDLFLYLDEIIERNIEFKCLLLSYLLISVQCILVVAVLEFV